MAITLTPLDPTDADREALIRFMTSSSWPFHVRTQVTREQVEENIAAGAYKDDDHAAFWLDHPSYGRVGYVRLEDLSDGAPLFDLRLDSQIRGRGLGAEALRALTNYVFTTMPDVTRFEGQTREDNIAMRRIFVRCDWVKEAHYRQAWAVEGGTPKASVAYAILRDDWENGTVTPVIWDDMPD